MRMRVWKSGEGMVSMVCGNGGKRGRGDEGVDGVRMLWEVFWWGYGVGI